MHRFLFPSSPVSFACPIDGAALRLIFERSTRSRSAARAAATVGFLLLPPLSLSLSLLPSLILGSVVDGAFRLGFVPFSSMGSIPFDVLFCPWTDRISPFFHPHVHLPSLDDTSTREREGVCVCVCVCEREDGAHTSHHT